MKNVNPYIHFNGNAEEAFCFYRSVFGGDFSVMKRFRDLPDLMVKFLEDEGDKMMHIALPLGKNSMLRGSDTPKSLGTHNERENRSKIYISTESKEEADKLFQGLSADGQVEMPMENAPWNAYFGMLRDKYGIEWMIEYTVD